MLLKRVLRAALTPLPPLPTYVPPVPVFRDDTKDGRRTIEVTESDSIKTLAELLTKAEVSLLDWEVERYTVYPGQACSYMMGELKLIELRDKALKAGRTLRDYHNKVLTTGTVPLELLEKQIDALLPQTQCTKCGYDGCRPYAQAIVQGEADINQCPPGGDAVVARLAQLLHREPKALNPKHGEYRPPSVAVISTAKL